MRRYIKVNNMVELFYRIMYRTHNITVEAPSGRIYCVEYHRSPFWTYDKRTLKVFFKDKFKTWHGQVWEVFPNGGRCGFGTTCIIQVFPKKHMREFLLREVKWLENILNNGGNDETSV